MQRITQYDGLYGEAEAETTEMQLPDHQPDMEYLYSELLETRSQNFDWVIQPHIHARLFQVFFIDSGSFDFQEATRQRQLKGPCVLLIPPTALHGFVYGTNTRGRILTLSDALVDRLFPDASPIHTMLGTLQCLTLFKEPYPAERIDKLMATIDGELFDNQPEKRLMLHALLQQLFLAFYRQWQQAEVTEAKPNSLALHYFRKFQQRVRQVGTTHAIAQLADELAITPVHLNRICRSVAGKSASQLVQEHILNEARKHLTYSSHSISEIAYLLHFEYPNYFAKFFRKHTRLSPTEYREQQLNRNA